MRTSKLLKKAVQDRRKVHEGMQKHAIRRGVFVTLDSGRQIKAHVMPTTAYPKQNPARRLTAGSTPFFVPLRGTGWNGVISNPHEKRFKTLAVKRLAFFH
jgi:hypothetical protein